MVGSGARPFYVTIAEELRKQITDGDLAIGDQVPTEAVLCQHYGVSRMTVRQALDTLVSSGYLVRRRGKGTFVVSDKAERSASQLLGFEEDTKLRGMTPATRVLKVGWAQAGKEELQLLGLKQGARIKQVDRLRTVNGEPIGLNHIVLLEKWAQLLGEEEFGGSLYDLLATALRDQIKEAEQRIEATPATQQQADLLQVQVGAPLLRIVRTTYLERNGLIGLTRTYYRGDRYFLSLKVSRKTLGPGATA